MPARRLVLASASPARLRLLRDAGFDPEVVPSEIDESVVGSDDPWTVVRALAVEKATVVAGRVGRGPIVVGCDSMLLFDGEILGKPRDADEAIARWQRMRGKTGVLLTGHCVIDADTGRSADDVADTVVRFGEPTDDEIRAYVASGEPLRVAGAFTLDGRSAPFVEGIEGDAGNVIGLSMPLFRRLLQQVDVELTELWT